MRTVVAPENTYRIATSALRISSSKEVEMLCIIDIMLKEWVHSLHIDTIQYLYVANVNIRWCEMYTYLWEMSDWINYRTERQIISWFLADMYHCNKYVSIHFMLGNAFLTDDRCRVESWSIDSNQLYVYFELRNVISADWSWLEAGSEGY